MEHVVFFPASDGTPSFRRVPSLDEAVRLVEHLRNVEGLSTVSVHSLSDVPLAFRAYYRVEVPTVSVPAQHTAPVAGPADARPAPDQAPVPALAPTGLVLVEDLGVDDETATAQDAAPVDDRPVEPALPAPASLGFFA